MRGCISGREHGFDLEFDDMARDRDGIGAELRAAARERVYIRPRYRLTVEE
jgi:hypothetical protein